MSEHTNIPEESDVLQQDTGDVPESAQSGTSAPEEPEILIQDLEDIPESPQPQPEEPGNRCARCDASIPDGETFCEKCRETMSAYPVSGGAWIGVVLALLVSLFALFVLSVNLMIANPVVKGDDALEDGDLRACYNHYEESYSIASRLNDLLFANSDLPFFTNGTRTLEKQIIALRKLNGPYQAGKAVESYFAKRTPKSLKPIRSEYETISAFVEEMQTSYYAYKNTLQPGEKADCEELLTLVDDAVKKLPETPEYVPQYYRFSFCFSAADDPVRTCKLLDELIEMQPDALWMYASEGIRAYNQNEEYEKALSICNDLMKLDSANAATVAYTMAELRLMQKYDDALMIYDRALKRMNNTPSSEMQRQLAIIGMLQGNYAEAQGLLVDSFDPSTATLDHIATIALCAFANNDQDVFLEYKTLLDSYMPYEQVDLFAAGECTLEDIFLTGGGEVQ